MEHERVAVVTESFLPTVNGVTTSVARLLDHLRDRGHQALVIAPDCGSADEYRGFPIIGVPAIVYRRFSVGLPNPRLTGLLAAFSPTVLHAASPFLLGGQAIQSARRLGVPSVAVYQTDVAGYARHNRLGAMTGLAWAIIRSIHNAADKTLAPSTAAIDDLHRAGVQRVALWRRGVDLTGFHPRLRQTPAATALRRQIAPDGETVLGYVGRLAPEKGLERLLTLADLPRTRLVVVGDGPSRATCQVRLRAARPVFLGELHGTQLAAAYGALDVFVHTGTQETFGQTLQEAAACGLPVIAPRAGGPLDLVQHGVTGMLYDPDRPAELRGAAQQLTEQPGLRARMGEAGRRAVLGRGWDVVCAELLAHYRAVRREASLAPAGRP